MLASYLGHFRHAQARRLEHAMWRRYPWLNLLFARTREGQWLPRWEPARVRSLQGQWRYFKRCFRGAVILFQIGRNVAVCERDAEQIEPWFVRQALRVIRPGFVAVLEWPLAKLAAMRARLRRRAVPHVFVAEEGYLRGGLKRRVLRLVWLPQGLPAA